MHFSYQEARGQNNVTRVLQVSNISFRYPWEQTMVTTVLLTSENNSIGKSIRETRWLDFFIVIKGNGKEMENRPVDLVILSLYGKLFFIEEVIQPSDHLFWCPFGHTPKSPYPYTGVPIDVYIAPEGYHESRIEEENHIPCLSGHTSFYTAHSMIGFVGCRHTSLAYIRFFISKWYFEHGKFVSPETIIWFHINI